MGPMEPHLAVFLRGTVKLSSPLCALRGHSDLLRKIWILVCEEWWNLHIDRTFSRVSHKYWKGGLCDLRECTTSDNASLPCHGEDATDQEGNNLQDGIGTVPETTPSWINVIAQSDESEVQSLDHMHYPRNKIRSGGCPVAVVQSDVKFPPKVKVPTGTFKSQESEHLYVSMMPIRVTDITSVPEVCRGYWPLIKSCARLSINRRGRGENNIGYLTIDERPVPEGKSQRRAGLHVDFPGVLPVIQKNETERTPLFPGWGHESERAENRMRAHHSRVSGGMFVPGADTMFRDERVDGGIFMASNVSGACAVWNCRVWDRQGDVIGPHGDIERLRPLLGSPARTLDAGELVWMTDKTPHESLPLPGGVTSRQYFRLVVGEVTAWFADDSTPNPIRNIILPSSVRIVYGNKSQLYSNPHLRISNNWHCGTPEAFILARGEQEVQELAMRFGLGHLVERMILYGITSVNRLLELSEHFCDSGFVTFWDEKHSADGLRLFLHGNSGYYDIPQFKEMVRAVRANHLLVTTYSGNLCDESSLDGIYLDKEDWFV